MSSQLKNMLIVLIGATAAGYIGAKLGPPLVAVSASEQSKGLGADVAEHPEAVYQGGRAEPSEQPIVEHWEDEYFPFVGFEVEPAGPEAIKASSPTSVRKHPLDSEVLIPAGVTAIGDERLPGSRPVRHVNLEAYFIDRYEVSNSRYASFIKATGRRAPYVHENWAAVYNWYKDSPPKGMGEVPVILVTWKDAKEYCAWAGKRLPTELEWERAARGTQGHRYPWGDSWDSRNANVVSRLSGPLKTVEDWDRFEAEWTGSKKSEIFAVGGYPTDRSAFGVMDMFGNVSEWVDGFFEPYPDAKPDERKGFGRTLRVARGNSWGNRDYSTSLAIRYPYEESRVDSVIGFRCARDAR